MVIFHLERCRSFDVVDEFRMGCSGSTHVGLTDPLAVVRCIFIN